MNVFDPNNVEDAFGDDPEGTSAFVTSVRASCAQTVAKLVAAIEAGDVEGVRSTAHSLRGTGGHLGAAELMDLAGSYETAARAGTVDPDPLKAASLQNAAKRLDVEIGAYLEKLGAR